MPGMDVLFERANLLLHQHVLARLLPLRFGAVSVAAIMTAIWGAVLHCKIILEEEALSARR